MKVIHDGDPGLAASESSVVSIGTFDGVHLGHQHVLRHLRAEAEARDVLSAVVTFDIHPALVLRPENAPKILMSLDRSSTCSRSTGRRGLVSCTSTTTVAHHFRRLRAQVFADALHARAVVVGEDFHFGAQPRGKHRRAAFDGRKLGFESTDWS